MRWVRAVERLVRGRERLVGVWYVAMDGGRSGEMSIHLEHGHFQDTCKHQWLGMGGGVGGGVGCH